MNSAQIVGTILNKPELAYTDKRLAICKVMIHAEKAYEKQTTQPNIPITFFGARAEAFAQVASKGAIAYIECSITSRERPGKNGGSFYNIEFSGQHWVIQPGVPNIEPPQPQKGPTFDTFEADAPW